MLQFTAKRATLLTALILSSISLGNQLHAQEQEEDKWYQVEVAIFTQSPSAQLAASQEQFRKDVILSYGPKTIQLGDPDPSTEALNQRVQETSTAAVGRPLGNAERAAKDMLAATTPLTPAEIEFRLANEAFVKLPPAMRGLNETVAALERRNRQRILFHQAWRQPLTEPDQAGAIIIQGGDVFGEDRELNGTITIGASRYIHFNSNLWLAEFTSNYGQGDQGWPSIPHTQLTGIELTDFDAVANSDDLGSQYNSAVSPNLWAQFDAIDSTYQKILNKPYVITNLATLLQNRRMRSGEVHYIDHPKFGVLVTITPYERPLIEEPVTSTVEQRSPTPAITGQR